MKIRSGFVSNSSSSSFILIVSDEDHIKALDILDGYGKKFIEKLMTHSNVGGMNVRVASFYESDEHGFKYLKVDKNEDEDDDALLDKKMEIYETYVRNLKDNGANIFQTSIDY